MKRVTVIVPCYNGEKFVAKCIESLLNQTTLPDEILVIDDGSTDNSVSVIRKHDVQLIRHEANKGLAEARNTGIKNAKGDVLIFVDVDAYADPKLVESLLSEYSNEKIAGVGGQGIESNIQSVYDRWRKLHSSQSSGDEIIENSSIVWGLCSSYKREVLDEVGGFDRFYKTNGEDEDIGIRLRKKGYHLVYTPNAKVYHQRTDNLRTLCNMVYRSWYWGEIAKRRNGERAFTVLRAHVHATVRNLRINGLSDLVHQKNLRLAFIDLVMFLLELKATTIVAFSKMQEKVIPQSETDARFD